jgi:hypothetical protein
LRLSFQEPHPTCASELGLRICELPLFIRYQNRLDGSHHQHTTILQQVMHIPEIFTTLSLSLSRAFSLLIPTFGPSSSGSSPDTMCNWQNLSHKADCTEVWGSKIFGCSFITLEDSFCFPPCSAMENSPNCQRI